MLKRTTLTSLALVSLCAAFSFHFPGAAAADPPARWWNDAVENALVKARDNRAELEKALTDVPKDERPGMAFLIANMPDGDLKQLKAEFLLNNTSLAYKARKEFPWGKDVPEEVFLNHVLPYANVDEKRDDWRKEFYELCKPIAKECKTPTEVTKRLNAELFKKLKLGYSTQRRAANQSPSESIEQGKASCTGLSIVLSDACRSVGVPARLVGTALWANKSGNHTWVEIWDKDWHFTGACEPDPNGLDRGWFVGNASQAVKDSPQHAIFAAKFEKTEQHFPLVWARGKKDVPAENVTDRYAKAAPKKETVHVNIRVVAADRKRVALPVLVTMSGDAKWKGEGTSRGESADTNDYLSFELKPGSEYTVDVSGVKTTFKTEAAGKEQTVEVQIKSPASAPFDAEKSAAAVKELKATLASNPAAYASIATQSLANVPLSKADAAAARTLLWNAHVEMIRKERKAEVENRLLKDGKLEMPFFYKTFGEKPAGGRSLWISMHGGGGAPPRVNDQQYENQKRLYTLQEGIYLAPRAPTNTWNLWHEGHIDRFFARLIEDLIVFEDVNPDRIYLMGYSAGGDGVYQMGPRMADSWAAAGMMAGHPNGVSLLSLRNCPFAIQVGGNDAAYGRNKVGKDYGDMLDKLQKDDPFGYVHSVKIYEGKPHWMGGEDKAALPWMAKFTRDPIPDRIVWKQTGTPHTRFYWLAVPAAEAKGDSLIRADRKGQSIMLTEVEKAENVIVRLDDRMVDLDKPVTITYAGKTLLTGTAPRTIGTMIRTLVDRGDPRQVFDSEVVVAIPSKP